MRGYTQFLPIFLISFLFINIINATVFTSVIPGDFESPDTWDVGGGMIPGEMDDVVVLHAVNLSLTSDKKIKSLSISNDANVTSGLQINGTGSFVVLNNVTGIASNFDVDTYLLVGGNVILTIKGNCHFTRKEINNYNKHLNITLKNSSNTFISGTLEFDYDGSGFGESEKEIIIKNNAFLEVTGATRFSNTSGQDFNLGMYDNAGAIFRDSLTLSLTDNGSEAGITLHDSSYLQILSNAYIFNSSTTSNDFAKLRVRESASNLYVQGNVYLESQGAKVKLEAEGSAGVVTITGDIIIDASAEDEAIINIVEKAEIYLGGDIIRQTNFGKLTMLDEGALVFNGSAPQAIPKGKLQNSGTDSLFFKNIRLENTSAQTFALTNDLIVKDALMLTSGNLKTDSTAMVILQEGATISGSSDAYIEGPVRKLGSTGGQHFTFPIGTNTDYAPITISPIANSSSEITVAYLSEPPPFGVRTFENGINNVSSHGHWTVDKNANTGDLNLTLNWEDSNEIGVNEVDDLVVAGWDGSEWKSFGQESAGVVGTGGFVESAASEPPPFGVRTVTIASTSSANALPVELKNFKVMPRSGSIDLKWETESEINASHFLVEHTSDGVNYKTIDYIQSKGGATIAARYTTRDLSPSFGWNYYRLKMVDLDGSYEYSPVEAVKLVQNTSIMVYPNPVKEVLFIQDTEAVEGAVRVEIFDRNSSRLHESNINLDGGPVQLAIDDIQSFPSGYYIVKITGDSGCTFVNFVIAE